MIDVYLEKISEEFPIKKSAAAQQKRNYKYKTYKELYEDYLDRYQTLDETQDLCVFLTGADIYKLDEFRNKTRCLADHFLYTLFSSRESIPAKPFIAKCKRIRKGLEILNEQAM